MAEQATTRASKPKHSDAAGGADLDNGLTTQEAQQRLAQYGENGLAAEEESLLHKLLSYFWGPIPWMIEAAAILSAVVKHWMDLAVILAMLLINAGVGFWQEYKADSAIEQLKQRLALKARVLRDGQWQTVEAKTLVPGDVVSIRMGDVIPADLRLAALEDGAVAGYRAAS